MNNEISLTMTELGKHLLKCKECSSKFSEIVTHQVMEKKKK